MRVVFIGASSFGLRALETLYELEPVELVGVVTNAKTFSISYSPNGVTNVLHADVAPFAKRCGLQCYHMQDNMQEPKLLSQMREWRPDLIVVVGWYHMVPRVLRDMALTVGLHASLLPEYSGGAPLVWAMINGEEKAGISLFVLEKGVDSGDILGQKSEIIHDQDTIASLYARIEERGLELLQEQIPKIADGTFKRYKQDESKRTIYPQRSPDDGLIDFKQSAVSVYNFIRAQTRPYPGAFFIYQDQKVTVWKAKVSREESGSVPGTLVIDKGCVSVAVDDGQVILEEVEVEGCRLIKPAQYFQEVCV